ncbi:hypothetical protein BHE74_00046072 [Ensete ventricosum]|nr:hypothetical protein BHE74_00046072 [Ensete ventricosum]RZS01664.1 hypothetical protein BHM03_00031559 [Ensete ventricosum]
MMRKRIASSSSSSHGFSHARIASASEDELAVMALVQDVGQMASTVFSIWDSLSCCSTSLGSSSPFVLEILQSHVPVVGNFVRSTHLPLYKFRRLPFPFAVSRTRLWSAVTKSWSCASVLPAAGSRATDQTHCGPLFHYSFLASLIWSSREREREREMRATSAADHNFGTDSTRDGWASSHVPHQSVERVKPSRTELRAPRTVY